MKILKVGPGFGHNMEQFVRFFESEPDTSVTLLYNGRFDFAEYENIEYIPFSMTGFLSIALRVVRGEFDVVWLHGGNRLIFIFSILKALTFTKRTLFVLNVWGEKIIRSMDRFGAINPYRFSASVFDVVQFNWFTLEMQAKKKLYDKVLTKTLLWGVPSSFFDNYDGPDRGTIDSLDDMDGYKFFYPKSFTTQSGHDLLLDAVELLDRTDHTFKVYLMEGNGRERHVFEKFCSDLRDRRLEHRFEFLEFSGYLPPAGMAYLWRKFDCALQVVKGDQLSSTLIEPQLCFLPIVASDLEQYRDYEKYFGVDLNLVRNDAQEIASRMENVMNEATSFPILRDRVRAICENYIFEINVVKMLEFYERTST